MIKDTEVYIECAKFRLKLELLEVLNIFIENNDVFIMLYDCNIVSK